MNAINYVAVLVSAAASFITSYVWFAMLFARPYLKGLDKTAEEMSRGPSALPSLAMQFVGTVTTTLVLAWLMQKTGHPSVGQGMMLALVVWVGFVAAVMGPMHAFQAYPLSFSLITTGGALAALLVSAAILGAWR